MMTMAKESFKAQVLNKLAGEKGIQRERLWTGGVGGRELVNGC